jgi:RNA polymerase sigma factor (sigma-70 family)
MAVHYQSNTDVAADVAAVQAGDTEAFSRIVRAYSKLIRKVARKYEEVLDQNEAFDIVVSALGEHLATVSPEDAKFLSNKVAFIATEALDAEMFPGIPKMSLYNLRKASTSMRAPVEVDDEPQKTFYEAAAYAGVSLEALENYRMLERAESFDAVLDGAFDDENPYDQDLAGGYSCDEIDTRHDPELSNQYSLSVVTDVTTQSIRESLTTKQMVQEAVSSLAPRQQEVVSLFMQGLNDTEIAAELGISRSSVITQRHRAFESLRSTIAL